MCRTCAEQNTYFDKERTYIAKFYERKGNRSGSNIYFKLMKMNSKAMEDVIFFYMLMKQRTS